jgi:hypothetical protein
MERAVSLAGPFGVRGETLTRLTDLRPSPLPCGVGRWPVASRGRTHVFGGRPLTATLGLRAAGRGQRNRFTPARGVNARSV